MLVLLYFRGMIAPRRTFGFSLILLCILVAARTQPGAGDLSITPSENTAVALHGIIKELPFDLPGEGEIQAQQNEAPLFTAWVKKGKLNGVWQSFYPDRSVCDSGNLINNLPDGKWILKNNKGDLLSVRHFSVDKFKRVTEEMLRFHPKRNRYYLAAMYQQSKTKALHYLEADYAFQHASAIQQSSTLKELVMRNTAPGNSYRPVFVQGLLDGLYMNYFPGAVVKDSGIYKNGLKTGKWIHRETAGEGWLQGAYNHGYRIKEWKYYSVDGRLDEILHYDNHGKLIWRKKIKRG